MFGQKYAAHLINRSASNETNRRAFLKAASLTGLGVVGAGVAAGTGIANASPASTGAAAQAAAPIDDPTILNFALNLEYLEAEFYQWAAFGQTLNEAYKSGTGTRGQTTGGHVVPFKNKRIIEIAREIANDERSHVYFLRANLGNSAVAFPAIDLKNSFTLAARAAGLISSTQSFDPFASEANFLLGAYIFEDVGVTAYKGASPLIQNTTYREAAAGILATEAYHAGCIRTLLLELGLTDAPAKISNARDSLDGSGDDDQGILGTQANANITPLDGLGIAYSRSPQQVMNIVYLKAGTGVTKGGFFPNGLNGDVNTT